MRTLFQDLNSMRNRVIAQEYEENRKYLVDHIVTMKHFEKMLKSRK